MTATALPLVLCGPILRRLTPEKLTLWLAASRPLESRLHLYPDGESQQEVDAGAHCRCWQAGEELFFYLFDIPLQQALPYDCFIGYDLQLRPVNTEHWQPVTEWASDICYPGQPRPGFVLRSRLDRVLHGSCRKPHYDSADGLLFADAKLQQHFIDPQHWPSVLMMSGDQVYVDDVGGPMLVAIHGLLAELGLPVENIAEVQSSEARLHDQDAHYYRRDTLLPTEQSSGLQDVLFRSVEKPVFTSDHAHNHLITLGEVLAMYLLVWSPAAWEKLSLQAPPALDDAQQALYSEERHSLDHFIAGLPRVRRVMAHLPVAMIFDDHDITDDWNLTAGWEQSAYSNPFSRRVIGNALLGYLICQGWGNAPEHFPEPLLEQVVTGLQQPGSEQYDVLLDELLKFPRWHYHWDYHTPLVVLDTRTHRWRSEKNLNWPSGLMDWEALTDLQNDILGHESVVIVSPAPIFGVKLIETVQRIFTWVGKPLLVDAENWMAHAGSAHALLNMFRHPRTPKNFVILSGDVHYSFAYDIQLRGRQGGPEIWQITSSGIRNEFPAKLLDVFDRLNRWLYAPLSPLNWFTKRRGMKIIPYKPANARSGERLLNASGIGWLELDHEGAPVTIQQLTGDERSVEFLLHEDEASWE
ncbi:alkaline phosphatase D family protein [Aliamphritea spongicola]|uniref:alkaline phosphatase D family protein n=1 Tax=Aliamphritea spongicola TaxID=707589 RepID=UPI00196BAD6B|nr:alkaline phosphatase D family protein [Aliamphritea spongicola]MBN3564237.1 alkaline phosphatase family protein [Aliamphritea spongicola]